MVWKCGMYHDKPLSGIGWKVAVVSHIAKGQMNTSIKVESHRLNDEGLGYYVFYY